MTNRTCTVDGCERDIVTMKMCQKHYVRLRKTGTTDDPKFHKVCTFPECGRPHASHGYCSAHVKQMKKGEALRPVEIRNRPIEERFHEKIDKSGTCWVWTATRNPWGYPFMNVGGRAVAMHRWSFENYRGPIPEGMQVDHICHTRACVRPDHLRLATPKHNAEYRRGANCNSKSGVRNVYQNGKRWVVQVRHNDVLHNGGTHDTIEQADKAAQALRAELFNFADA